MLSNRLNLFFALIVLSHLSTGSASSQSNTPEANAELLADAVYDRFTDTTTLEKTLDLIKYGKGVRDAIDLSAVITFEGKSPKAIKRFALKLRYYNFSTTARFISDDAYLIVDQQRFVIPLVYPEPTRLTTGLVVEVPLSTALFAILRNARAAEFKVGNDEHSLSGRELAILRDLLAMFGPATGPSSPTTTISPPRKVRTFLEVSSDRVGFLDVPVKSEGVITITDYYTGDYLDARQTHYAFKIYDIGETFPVGWLYMRRGPNADALRAQLLDSPTKRVRGSFSIVIMKGRYKPIHSAFTAELTGFGSPDK